MRIKGGLRKFSGAEVITSKPPKGDLARKKTYLIRLSTDKLAPDKTISEKQCWKSLVMLFPYNNAFFFYCYIVVAKMKLKNPTTNKIMGLVVINQYTAAILLQNDMSELT